ncbi:hypothetical protein F5Y06DRAFT_292535 [Hypoxylon sp. FL0890]|nr:hypothetical protein F5Y06DRAFT_292535 [Hypoxylon sp. FL0890]
MELPSDLVEIPDWYDDLKVRPYYPQIPFSEPVLSWRWGDIRARMSDIIRDMVEKGEIPREIKLKGMFIVRPKCPEFFVCQLDAYTDSAYRRTIPTTESSVGPHWGWKYEHPSHSEDQQPTT